MTYLGFQREVIRQLGWRRSEADFADNENWIVEDRERRRVAAGHARA